MHSKSRKLTIATILLATIILGIYAYIAYDQEETALEALATYKNASIDQITNYYFDIEYNEQLQMISGELRATIPNRSLDNLEELYFHLYPNAFSNWKWEEISKPKTEGYIIITKAAVNQIEVVPHQNETLLKINLPIPLKPQEQVDLHMTFELKLPENGVRLSYSPNTVFLAQWYPMLAVYDNDGWHIDPYTTVGDPFFSEVANFHVNLTLPEDYYAVSTATDSVQDANEVVLTQNNVRDFAIMITKEYEKLSAISNKGVKVNLYYLNNQLEVAALLLGSAVEAMDFYDEAFGAYPLEEIDIVLTETGYGIAGMEYPGLVTSNHLAKNSNRQFMPAYNVVAHELAHQWWYSTVGNNQIKEPWLDEGLTSFSEYLYMEQVLKRTDIDELMNKLRIYTDGIAEKNNIGVVQSIYTYGEYYPYFVYGRPAAMLWELKNSYGIDKVKEILQTYYEQYKFKIATTEDFINVVNDVIGKDMTSFFNEWLIIEE